MSKNKKSDKLFIISCFVILIGVIMYATHFLKINKFDEKYDEVLRNKNEIKTVDNTNNSFQDEYYPDVDEDYSNVQDVNKSIKQGMKSDNNNDIKTEKNKKKKTSSYMISGIVVNSKNEPLQDITVSITKFKRGRGMRGDRSNSDEFKEETLSAPDGKFAFDNLSSGTYMISAITDNFANETTFIQLSDEKQAENVILKLYIGGNIIGSVTDSKGNRVPDKEVILLNSNRRGPGRRGRFNFPNVKTDVNGEYVIKNIPPDSYNVYVITASNRLSIFNSKPSAKVNVMENETVYCDIIISEEEEQKNSDKCRVYGQILSNGNPADMDIAFSNFDDGNMAYESADVDEDGNYEVMLTPGKYQYGRRFRVFGEVEVPDKNEFNFDIDLPELFISGIVVNASNAAPIENASLMLIHSTDFSVGNFSALRSLIGGRDSSKEDGSFEINYLQPGNYILQVSHKDFGIAETQIIIDSDPIEDIQISLSPGGYVTGIVTDSTGSPIQRATFEIRSSANDVPLLINLRHQIVTDERGIYKTNMIAEGAYIITATSSNYAANSKPVNVYNNSETTVDFVLNSGGTIKIETVDENGQPLSGVFVDITNVDSNSISMPLTFVNLMKKMTSDKEGIIKIEHLTPGEYLCSPKYKDDELEIFNLNVVDDTITSYTLKVVVSDKSE